MKTILTSIIIFIAASIFYNLFSFKKIFAQQSCLIDSIYILPENPTEGDSVFIVCTATFYSGPAFIHSMDILVEGNNIKMFMKYFQGAAHAITTITDTLNIGVYMEGEYHLIFDVENYFYFSEDTTFLGTCIDSLMFYVTSDTKVDEIIVNKSFSLYPNPASNHITVKTTANQHLPYQLEIFDITGRIVHSEVLSVSKILININMLHSGMYFVKIQQGSNVQLKKFIKN